MNSLLDKVKDYPIYDWKCYFCEKSIKQVLNEKNFANFYEEKNHIVIKYYCQCKIFFNITASLKNFDIYIMQENKEKNLLLFGDIYQNDNKYSTTFRIRTNQYQMIETLDYPIELNQYIKLKLFQ